MGQPNSQHTADELLAIHARLTELEAERQRLLRRKRILQQRQAKFITPSLASSNQLGAAQKVALFRDLFKGRSDVFARRWENPGKGRSGYAVACHNEWRHGLCNKPKIKCGECQNRRYQPPDERAIHAHLTGKQVMGLYPLLTDNTCYLLAADFDKVGWRDAVKAMADICKGLGIPHAIEVSRSGNGAHLWIFFSEPVLAREARLLGFGLLDRAMEIYPDLSFDSYDRLFPNQDVMPEGGFGNLIALPLQYHARRQGNSQFVDANLSPYPDQWEFLSQIGRLTRNRLTQLMEQFSPRLPEADDSPPWEQGVFIEDTKILDVPKQLTITLANHLYFGLDEMPSKLTARLKRLASLSNPVFFKTQAMRFSTHGIPRYITCAKIEQGYLSLPRGCFDDAMALLEGQDIAVEIQDKREFGRTLESVRFMGELRRDQKSAVTAITAHDTGILHAPTAFGKTVTAIGVIVKRRVNTLILTHTRQLLTQWRERIRSFLTGVEIGTIGAGKRKPTTQIDIATYQSLMDRRNNSVSPIVGQYGQVIIDECHHISAPRFDMVLSEVRAKYVLGLTATPHRQDGHQKIVFMLAGPVRHKVRAENKAQFQQLAIVNRLHEQPPRFSETPHISDIYRWLTESVRRNRRIVDDVAATIESERHPLVLTERREHAERLAEMLSERGFRAVVLRGAMRAKESKAANEQLPAAQVIVATGKYIGEGFDLPRLDTLFLALPISWKGSLVQYAGRIHRESLGKTRVTVYDYVDCALPMLERMYRRREKGYRAMGYEIREEG
uniref:Helicase conserved C-terminal domain-containing protein n=1 Tax=Candidatus Kentrum sp. TUN TaxID=2126343 RepID=A0A450ZL79_9GAMM|nr:MAG: hypothetical protein BECKTUN1418F_GA0071002_10452 [Candidatus Kentron sp. TUN]VFK57092.1 MAG: hypothetical protein BECKTUN1418E_GA0071001_10442 [Candidatus Kentron sp. TUN]